MSERTDKGLIQVYTGDGKGKTTAALGLAIRAVGHGMRVGFIQFVKSEPCGEHLFISRCHPFEIVQMSIGDSFTKPREKLREEVQRTLAYSEEQMLNGGYDLLILDEILVTIYKGLITTQQLLDVLEKKPSSVELVLTGRGAPPEVIERADLVTEMHMIKHPFNHGVTARCGIEY